MKRFAIALICILLLPGFALADLTIYFLDVGQGDSAVIVCDGEAMIIDGGLPGQKVYEFIKRHEIKKLKYMVCSHPDEDHVGGLAAVLNAVPVDTILSPVKDWKYNNAFQDFKKYAEKQGAPISIPYEKDEFELGGSVFTILSCYTSTNRPNEMSICLRIDYGDTSFMFTGDLDGNGLERLLYQMAPLKATVLKISHHGSDKANPEELLKRVEPEYAVISCGKNKYGHPGETTLKLLKDNDVNLFRTDLQGTITCVSNGEYIEFSTERQNRSDVFTTPTK